MLVFGHATDMVMDAVGLDEGYRAAHDASLYTVEAHVRYLARCRPGRELEVRSSVIGATGKLLRIWHELWVEERLRATEEVLGVHVVAGRSAGFPEAVAARVAPLLTAPPDEAGRAIGLA